MKWWDTISHKAKLHINIPVNFNKLQKIAYWSNAQMFPLCLKEWVSSVLIKCHHLVWTHYGLYEFIPSLQN